MTLVGRLAARALGVLAALGACALPARAATSVPFALVNDHVYVDVALNGMGPYHFVIDSGAPDGLLDDEVARELRLRVSPHGTVGGVGDGEARAGDASVRTLRVGDRTFAHERFVVTPLRATIGAAEGRRIDGILGRDVLARAVTTFDYERSTVVFGSDVRALVRGGATLLPMRVVDGVPQIDCLIAAVAATCNVDTGSRLPVTVLAAFAAAHPQTVPATLSAVGVDGFGLGGPALGRLGRLSALAFGGFVLRDIVCDYSTQRRGAFANPALGANVGGGVWRRFALTLDYAHRRIALRANAGFDRAEPPDRSGLFLVGAGAAVLVLDVRPDTPASRAGIAKNDRILAVDGDSVTHTDVPAIRATLTSQPPATVVLRIERAGVAREVVLALDDYVPPPTFRNGNAAVSRVPAPGVESIVNSRANVLMMKRPRPSALRSAGARRYAGTIMPGPLSTAVKRGNSPVQSIVISTSPGACSTVLASISPSTSSAM
ncbi:MAG: hypothetical protein NVSMB19_12500 [Vulcanimicrobiaceae bacterium]